MNYVAEGYDYAWGRPDPALIVASGRKFACRYLSHDTTGKNLTLDETVKLSAAGLSIVLVFESTAERMLSGLSAGVADAAFARQAAAALGMPGDRPVFFACDFDASSGQQPKIGDYLDGAIMELGRSRVGIYGPYGPVKRTLDAGKIIWAWQTYAWSGGLWDPRAQIQQYSNDHMFDGVQLDYDRATTADYGQWRIGEITISKADQDAIIAGVLQGLSADVMISKIIAGVLAGTQPPVIDMDALATKILDNLVRRLEP